MRSGLWRVVLPLTLAFGAASAACTGAADEPAATTFAGTDAAALYAGACATCHGADLQGTDRGPPFLNPIYRPGHHADASFLLAVRRGVRSHHWNFGNMPAIPGLSDEQVAAITRFVRERQRAVGIE